MKKLADIGNVDNFRSGRSVKVGAWRVIDLRHVDGTRDRLIYHYGTHMGTLAFGTSGMFTTFVPYSMGWGSVSDQGGMNKILAAAGLPLRYRRDAKGGGARYEQVSV